ncbi:MAG: AI-2E family transporter [Porticoccaceae bacterium]
MKKVLQRWMAQYFGTEEAVLLSVFVIAAIVILATLGDVLGPVIAALVFAFLLQGVVNNLQKYGFSKIVSVLSTYILFLVAFITVLVVLIPIIGRQTSLLLKELPNMVSQLKQLLSSLPEKAAEYIGPEQIQLVVARISEEVANLAEQLLSLSISSFPSILAIMIYLFLVPLLVFFMLKDKEVLLNFISNMLPKERQVMTVIWEEMDIQFANYIRGKAIEIVIVGIVSFITFLFLDLKYAALLASLVGLSVLIPYIGATLVTIPVLLVGYLQWGISNDFAWLVALYAIIQIVDGNVLVPLLFSEVVNLHPVVIVIAVLIFGGIWGFWGLFFAIPLATLVKAIYNAWPRTSVQAD